MNIVRTCRISNYLWISRKMDRTKVFLLNTHSEHFLYLSFPNSGTWRAFKFGLQLSSHGTHSVFFGLSGLSQ